MARYTGTLVTLCVLFAASSFCLRSGDLPASDKGALYHFPLTFTENKGQWSTEVLFGLFRGRDAAVFMRNGFVLAQRDGDAVVSLRDNAASMRGSRALHMAFVQPSRDMRVRASAELKHSTRYYTGSDASHWIESARSYDTLRYEGVWPGIDVLCYGEQGKMHQQIILHRGARGRDVRFQFATECEAQLPMTVLGCEASALPMQDIVSKIQDGMLSFPALPDVMADNVILTTEFRTYFGGSGMEQIFGMQTDSVGNIYVTGSTSSTDLPVLRPWKGSFGGGTSDIFVASFACDGRTLNFCTFLGGTKKDTMEQFQKVGTVQFVKDALRLKGSTGTLYVHGMTDSPDFPLTPGAAQPVLTGKYGGYICALSKAGALLHSTFLATSEYLDITSLSVCSGPGVLVAGQARRDSLWFVKDGAAQSNRNTNIYNPIDGGASTHYVAKLSDNLDTVYWGSYLFSWRQDPNGASANWSPAKVITDSEDNAIVLGRMLIWDGGGPVLPQVNPAISFDSTCNRSQLYISKLNPRGTGYIFSSFYTHCPRQSSHDVPVDALCDKDGHILVYGEASPDHVMVNPAQPLSGGGVETFLLKVTPSGSIAASTFFGGEGGEIPESMDVDRCGNVVVFGRGNSRNFPFVQPTDSAFDRLRTPVVHFLGVFDPTCTKILKATYIMHDSVLDPVFERALLDDAGYVTYVGSTFGNRVYTVFNAYQAVKRGPSDGIIGRFRYPTCLLLDCAITAPDTILVERRSHHARPDRFTVGYTGKNISSDHSLTNLRTEILLPKGLVLDPPNQAASTALQPDALAMGMSGSAAWTLRVDSTVPTPGYFEIRFRTYYKMPNAALCPVAYEECSKVIRVLPYNEPQARLLCSLSGDSVFRVSTDGARYENSPFTLTWKMTNADTLTGRVAKVLLTAPTDQGIDFTPPAGTVRTGTSIVGGASWSLSWDVSAKKWLYGRALTGQVLAYDRWDSVISVCPFTIAAPGCDALPCRIDGPSIVRYDSASGASVPDTVRVTLKLSNVLDTTQTVLIAEPLPSASGHLEPLDIPVTNTAIVSRLNGVFIWRYRIRSSIPSAIDDTILVRYSTENHPAWRICALPVRIEPAPALICMVIGPDALSAAAGDSSYAPAPFQIRFIVRNGGLAPIHPAQIVLHAIPDGSCTALEPWSVLGRALPPGESDTVVWHLTALALNPNAHTIRLQCIAMSSEGQPLSECEKSIALPEIRKTMTCSLSTPDSIHYNLSSDTHTPNPFTASLTLGNVLDTAQQLLETEIDLSSAPHLALAAGEQARKDIATIDAHRSETVDWTLTILPPVTANLTEHIAVRYRHAGDTAWKQCERSILIEGAERITAAACSSMGHDSVWADAGYEAIIPHPVQVQYTITNTGNVPLAGCSAAIVHSLMYALVNPRDSIQTYPVVQPGGSASREWLLDPLLDNVQPVPEIVSWVWNCDKLAAAPQCTHSITLVAASPAAVVFTPWLLRFQAERNGPLPASQELRLWTGGAASMPWQLQSSTAWIDWQPSSGTDSARVLVVPNTTALPEGSHAGRIDMTAVPGVSPVGIRIVYDITTKTGMDDVAAPATSMLGQNYPNPAGGYTTITATLDRQSKARLLLYDAYGRLVAVVHDGELPAGRSSFQIDTGSLPSGMYWYSLIAGGRTEARMMMVVKR